MSIPGAQDGQPPVRIEVLRGTPSDEELAALVAVVTEEYERQETTAVAAKRPRTAWSLSARGLRGPLCRDVRWGAFSG